jgi:diguanylate cyclase (GGDEF)-like protein
MCPVMDLPAEEHAGIEPAAGANARERTVSALTSKAGTIAADAAGILPFSGEEPLDSSAARRLADLLLRLFTAAVGEARMHPESATVGDLHRLARERALSLERVFTSVRLLERSVLDELAVDPQIGAAGDLWPHVVQLLRRASFDLLAAYAERVRLAPVAADVTDRLTTLLTRPVIEAALAREGNRAARLGHSFALVMVDVDGLARINEQHGCGVGDRILERLGVLVRGFFRQHDWVGRIDDDAMAVLLFGSDVEHAAELAERLRVTVQERLAFTDQAGQSVRVTVSGAVLTIAPAEGSLLDPDRVLARAVDAVARAKRSGRNRVDYSRSS